MTEPKVPWADLAVEDVPREPKDLVHRLLVAAEPDAERVFTIVHDPRCPREDEDVEYTCAERFHETEEGLETYFVHSLDEDGVEHKGPYHEILEPGLYEVEAWSERVGHPLDPEEWDGGLRLLDKPREPYPGDLLPLPESHQLWVWMNGAKPPRWEVRGTGALIDDDTRAEMERRKELFRVVLQPEDVIFRTEACDYFAIDLMREGDKWVVCLEDVNK